MAVSREDALRIVELIGESIRLEELMALLGDSDGLTIRRNRDVVFRSEDHPPTADEIVQLLLSKITARLTSVHNEIRTLGLDIG